MKVLVTGAAGQLGYDVVNELRERNIRCIGTDKCPEAEVLHKSNWDTYVQLDLTDSNEVKKAVNDIKPDAIVHCAAWTDVDGAEKPSNRPLVRNINVNGTRYLTEAAKSIGCKFVFISTDYVFDGKGTEPRKPDGNDFSPLNHYGETKLEGESIVSSQLNRFFVVRISWAFGNGKNFIKTMLSLADKGYKELRVVDDQIGTPTYTYDLARLLVDMIQTEEYGFYHATNEGGYISWADFAEEIFKQAKKNVKVNRVTTA